MRNHAALAFDPNAFLAGIEHGKTTREYLTKQVVFSQGDAADAVFYLLSGKVQLTVVSARGKEAVIGVLERGSFFGEGCLTAQLLRMSTASAIQPSRIILTGGITASLCIVVLEVGLWTIRDRLPPWITNTRFNLGEMGTDPALAGLVELRPPAGAACRHLLRVEGRRHRAHGVPRVWPRSPCRRITSRSSPTRTVSATPNRSRTPLSGGSGRLVHRRHDASGGVDLAGTRRAYAGRERSELRDCGFRARAGAARAEGLRAGAPPRRAAAGGVRSQVRSCGPSFGSALGGQAASGAGGLRDAKPAGAQRPDARVLRSRRASRSWTSPPTCRRP